MPRHLPSTFLSARLLGWYPVILGLVTLPARCSNERAPTQLAPHEAFLPLVALGQIIYPELVQPGSERNFAICCLHSPSACSLERQLMAVDIQHSQSRCRMLKRERANAASPPLSCSSPLVLYHTTTNLHHCQKHLICERCVTVPYQAA